MRHTPRVIRLLLAVAALTPLAMRAEAGSVLSKPIHLTLGARYRGIVAEIDIGVCSHRPVTSQTTLVNWGDGAITRGDFVTSSATAGLFVLHGEHTYRSVGTYTVGVDVETTCGLSPLSLVDYASGSVTAIVTSTAIATPSETPRDVEALRRESVGVVRPTVVFSAAKFRLPLGLDLYRPVPENNPLTDATISLGRQLFHDRRLSRDGSLSCAGCHDPRRAFADGRPVAVGIGGAQGDRNAPAIVNRAWGKSFFWDGRASTLEQQVSQPILNPKELAMTPAAVVALARSDRYRRQFVEAFGAEPTFDDVARALAAYVRTIVTGDSPFDRYTAGDRSALSVDAQRGLAIFRGKAGCTACHVGPTFTDEQFHNTGVAWRPPASSGLGEFQDRGRAVVTAKPEDEGAFKTPTLREIARTAPYMHDGSLATLENVVEFYNGGGRPNPRIDRELHPLHLTAGEKQAVVAFLRSLTGRVREGSR